MKTGSEKKPTRKKRIRLLLVDDHPIVREGLRACLEAVPRFQIVGEASSGPEAVRLAVTREPDVVLMDISLGETSGLEATVEIRRQAPSARVILLTVHDSYEYVAQVKNCGAHGYLVKTAPPSALVNAIEALHDRGDAVFSPGIDQLVLNDYVTYKSSPEASLLDSLTQREQQVLKRVAMGLTSKEIGDQLSISPRTVENHRARVMQKIGVHNAAGLTKFAIQSGLLPARTYRDAGTP